MRRGSHLHFPEARGHPKFDGGCNKWKTWAASKMQVMVRHISSLLDRLRRKECKKAAEGLKKSTLIPSWNSSASIGCEFPAAIYLNLKKCNAASKVK
jgi:hypothetical protein